jgi:hypothetical protein
VHRIKVVFTQIYVDCERTSRHDEDKRRVRMQTGGALVALYKYSWIVPEPERTASFESPDCHQRVTHDASCSTQEYLPHSAVSSLRTIIAIFGDSG